MLAAPSRRAGPSRKSHERMRRMARIKTDRSVVVHPLLSASRTAKKRGELPRIVSFPLLLAVLLAGRSAELLMIDPSHPCHPSHPFIKLLKFSVDARHHQRSRAASPGSEPDSESGGRPLAMQVTAGNGGG